ncbi:MAG: transcription initiation factor IIB [Hadesarchaea archaeon]|nr:transcription initiation factor IIB [Hadesarchaea archaeon]
MVAETETRVKSESQKEVQENEDQVGKCSQCENSKLVRDYQQGILVCENCGYILNQGIKELDPEWRAFSEEQKEKRDRVGAPMTYTIHDKGLSTKIDWKNRDSKGKDLSPKKRSQMYRLRKWQRRIRVSDSSERNLAFALSEIDRMASQLGLPRNAREETSVIYRRAVDENLIRGRSIEGVSSAALYTACRKLDVPRTLEEVAEVSRVSKKEIGRSYRFIARELGIHLPPTNPINYIARFGSELEISGETRIRAIKILKKAKEERLTSGRGPTGLAAAAIYIASTETGERRTQREVAEVAKVTEVTIRNRYKELVKKLGLNTEL